MKNNPLFNNYNLSNSEIESILIQVDKDIKRFSYIDDKLDEDLKQIISIRIFKALSRNRKNFQKNM